MKRYPAVAAGNRYGRWTVLSLEPREIGTPVYWLCRCDCTRVVRVRGDNLRKGISKQCMICARRRTITPNLERIRAMVAAGKRPKEIAAAVGCNPKTIGSWKRILGISFARTRADLTGQRFGKWTVLREVEHPENTRESRWLCQCVCTKKSRVYISDLRSGRSRSCISCALKARHKKPLEGLSPVELAERRQRAWDAERERRRVRASQRRSKRAA